MAAEFGLYSMLVFGEIPPLLDIRIPEITVSVGPI